MKQLIVNHVWWITILLGIGMLAAHTFSFDKVKVDNTSIILLLVILLSPFISAITRIKYGDFEAEIDPKEVQKIKNEVSAQAIKAHEPAQNSEIEQTINDIRALVESDPILALAKLRIELENRCGCNLFKSIELKICGRSDYQSQALNSKEACSTWPDVIDELAEQE